MSRIVPIVLVVAVFFAIMAEGQQSLGVIGSTTDGIGIRISEVIPSGVGAKAGLSVGDVIIEIDGKPVRTVLERAEVMTRKASGTVTVTFLRKGQRGITTVFLDSQSDSPPDTASHEWLSLNSEFAKLALKALKAVMGDGSTPTFRNGEMFVSRHTSDALNEADAEAHLPGELQCMKALQLLYYQRLLNNSERKTIQLAYEGTLMQQYGRERGEFEASKSMEQDTRVQAMALGEQRCADELEQMLRARRFYEGKLCIAPE